LTAAVLAGAALLAAAAFGGSAAGLIIVTAACAAWAVWVRRKSVSTGDAGEGLALVSSVALPGGGRVHEVRAGGRTLYVAVAGNTIKLLDARGPRDGEFGDA
jgi:hypothetical protein